MSHFLDRFSIKYKLWFSSILLLVILLTVSITGWLSLKNIDESITSIARKIQPAVISAVDFESSLNNSVAMLGLYVKSGKGEYKNKYLDSLTELNEKLDKLVQNPVLSGDAELNSVVGSIAEDVEKYSTYKDTIVNLVENPSVNMTALKYMQERLNPKARALYQALGEMVLAEEDEDADEDRREVLNNIQELRYSLLQVVSSVRGYVGLRSSNFVENSNIYMEKTESFIKKLQAARDAELLTFEQLDAFGRTEQLIPAFFTEARAVMETMGSEKAFMDTYLIRTEIGPLTGSISGHIDAMVDLLRDLSGSMRRQMSEQSAASATLMWIMALLGVVIGGGILLIVSRQITCKLDRAVQAMEHISAGEGDLTSELKISGQDELARLANAFNKFLVRIRDTVCSVSKAVDHLNASVADMTQISSESSQGATRTQSETAQMAGSMQEMLRSSSEVTEKANTASNEASNANTAASEGEEIVNKTVISINSLATEVERASSVINQLEQGSERIGSVIDVIKGIAEQTNLLALNAAIEAARAGEQGRGFAVVADEVRTLASRTQESTEEISNVILELQSSAHQAVDAMQSSKQKTEQTVSEAEKTRASLSTISQAVSHITEMNRQIASSSDSQTSLVEQVNLTVQSISQVAEHSADSIQTLEAATSRLSDVAVELQQLVGGFRT